MKVAFCAHDRPDYVGGPNAGLKRLLPILRSLGIQSRVLFITDTAPEKCPTVLALRQQGFDCPAIQNPLYTEKTIRWILGEVKKDPPDIFIPNLVLPAFYAAKWIKKAGIPTVGVMRSDEDFYYGLLDEFVYGEEEYRLSALICVSKFLRQSVLNRKPEKVIIKQIPSGSVIPKLSARPPADKLKIVYTGRLVEEQKRISDLTFAFCRAVSEVPGTEATIYGDGPSTPAVREIIEQEGKGLFVSYAGRVDSDAIQQHLLEHHVVVLLSDYEGLPGSFMEAMACGLVPVSLNTRSGIPELVIDGVTGLLVNDRGDDFVSAIRKLKNDTELWQRLSLSARNKIEKEYSVELCAEKWMELFQELKSGVKPYLNISIPLRIVLPPVHSGLAKEDSRTPSLLLKILRISRKYAGKVKRRILQK